MGTDRYAARKQKDGRWAVVRANEEPRFCKDQRSAEKLARQLNDELEQDKHARRHNGA
jgi:hypothetical protein